MRNLLAYFVPITLVLLCGSGQCMAQAAPRDAVPRISTLFLEGKWMKPPKPVML